MVIRTTALDVLSANWWVIAVRGIVGILFGVLAFVLPLPTLLGIIWFFGIYALVDGIFNLVSLFRRNTTRPWWALALEGVVSLAAAAISFLMPGITAIALVYLIAAWAFVTGVMELIAALRLRREIKGEFWLVLSGIASVVLGALLVLSPVGGAIVLVWYLGAYALVFGALQTALGFRLRTRYEQVRAGSARMAA